MRYLLETPPNPVSLARVRDDFSQSLAEDLMKLDLKADGFSEADYLSLTGNYRVEFIDGRIQVLPMPTIFHNAVIFYLLLSLRTWRDQHDVGGHLTLSTSKVKLRDGQYREPDVVYMLARNAGKTKEAFWRGTDLAIEVVSEGNSDHDYITKRREYALHGVTEYWIVDPELNQILVLTLNGQEYAEHGTFKRGDIATSVLLQGFGVDIAKLLDDAARGV
jgi:Uma2 family endonuclease